MGSIRIASMKFLVSIAITLLSLQPSHHLQHARQRHLLKWVYPAQISGKMPLTRYQVQQSRLVTQVNFTLVLWPLLLAYHCPLLVQ